MHTHYRVLVIKSNDEITVDFFMDTTCNRYPVFLKKAINSCTNFKVTKLMIGHKTVTQDLS